MEIAHGIDLVDFGRIEQMLDRHKHRFLDRVFTAKEQAQAQGQPGAEGAGPGPEAGSGPEQKEEDVVDADFKVDGEEK